MAERADLAAVLTRLHEEPFRLKVGASHQRDFLMLTLRLDREPTTLVTQ